MSGPTIRFKLEFNGTDDRPPEVKYFAIDPEDRLVDISDLKGHIARKLDIKWTEDMDLLINDIVIDDYLTTKIIAWDEVVVVRRRCPPVVSESPNLQRIDCRRATRSVSVQTDGKDHTLATSSSNVLAKRPSAKRSKKSVRFEESLSVGSDGQSSTRDDYNPVIDLNANLMDTDGHNWANERPKRVSKPVDRYENWYFH